MKPTNQLQLLEAQLKQLRSDTPGLQRKLTLSKWTPLQWANERRLKQHLSEIDLLEKRIFNLRRLQS